MSGAGGILFDPVLPVPVIGLIAVVLLALTVWIYRRVGAPLGGWRGALLAALRLSGLLLVVALLLQPSRLETLAPPARDRVTLIGLDNSLSMKQQDSAGRSRFDAAKGLLLDSGALAPNGTVADARLRLFEFSDDARPIRKSVLDLTPEGRTTRFQKSIVTLLDQASTGETPEAMILLTDGHDFELVNPVKTGSLARENRTPVYAVAFGRQGKVRDVAVRISGFQPYCYVKQKARIAAVLRLVGCELEDIPVQLLRGGRVVQTRRVNAQQLQEVPVEFEVVEPETGQFEYEVRVPPLEDEADTANNSAITYLNVIDQQIRVLLLEGDPYWDTAFLQRSLMQNDKFDVDALVQYGPDQVRAIRKNPAGGDLRVPSTLEEFAAYDVIVLGRRLDSLLGLSAPTGRVALMSVGTPPAGTRTSLLDQYVSERGGTLIFSRGRAVEGAGMEATEPVLWGGQPRARVHLEATAEGRGLSPFRVLNSDGTGMDRLPELLDARTPEELKPLAATLAVASDRNHPTPEAAVVHRRYGRGQVVSIGVAGLWRWALNSQSGGVNLPFDRFWDQMLLWLLAGRDFIPSKAYSFRPGSANVLLGDKVYFRLVLRQPDSKLKSVPVTVYLGDAEAGRINLVPAAESVGRMTGDFLPGKPGRYRATVRLPDGSTQESRFIVFTENLEETEVATDTLYLRRLCESSGGRVLEPAELPKLLGELARTASDDAPKTVLRPVWNTAGIFYLAGLLFGLDWFLRRRWGLC
ncbi:MAG: hypothetical protein U1F98_04170 [Verrucomicrobiota bacterium]